MENTMVEKFQSKNAFGIHKKLVQSFCNLPALSPFQKKR